MNAKSSASATLPGSLQANPRLSQWLSIGPDGIVTFCSGKVELGQGIDTALAQIVAEELDVSLSRVRRAATSTAHSPNEGMTSGSLSVQESGSALRMVCAQVREIYLRCALLHLELPQTDFNRLFVEDGSIRVRASAHHPIDRGPTSYWALADKALLDCEASGLAMPKAAEGYRVVGQSVQRQAINSLVLGEPCFIQDMQLPNMVFGRVLHPPSPGAALGLLDPSAVLALTGVVKVVRDGNFLGVVANTEAQANQAFEKLRSFAQWIEHPGLPDMTDVPGFLRAQPFETTLVGERVAPPVSNNANLTQPAAAHHFQASYSRPFLAHASIGPSCALARYTPELLEIWTHSQGIFHLRADMATIFSMPPGAIAVHHVTGAGCYGHNGADDVACDAALLARALPGWPIRVQWSREDELACAPLGAAMAVTLTAKVTALGEVLDWRHEVWSNGHSMRPGRSSVPVLLAATLLETPFAQQVAINAPLAAGGGAERNAVPLYDFAAWSAASHRRMTMPLRTSALRSLGAHCNVFALESFLDEIASQLQIDPLAYRLRYLADERGRAVLEAAAAMAGWVEYQKAKRTCANAAGNETDQHGVLGNAAQGMGLAFARYKNTGAYCAVVAAVDASGRELHVKKLWIAIDVGLVVNPDGVKNQIEGGAIQTVSWVLKEAVQFDRTRVLSTSWESYPILRFSEVPQVEVQLVNRPDQKSLGAGEATHGPVAAAIANALADALGVRVRDMPLNSAQIQRAVMANDPA